ncbi:UNVERIFIED_CONTAM: hypothetical protein GTU68_044402 [Idotea baltica]|nr:hypothetical protein [Idotea baltica]
MSNLRPLHDRLIVKRLEESEKTAGGLFIPESAKEKPQKGEVIAIGKGKDVKAGDVVLFGKYSGTEVKIDNEDRLIMREDDVLAVVE